jgi:uncharacterized protein YbaP (TraB family)
MTFKRLLAASAALLALSTAACASPVDAGSVEVGASEVPPAGAVPGPALWQLSDEDTTIYLFGTVHVLPEGIDWYDARIARAFAASDQLVTEVDVGDSAAMAAQMTQTAQLTGGQTLRDLMTADDRAQYDAAMAGLGLPPAALDGFEPWFAAINLSMLPLLSAGYDPASGVESELAGRAGDKQRGALETLDQQLQLFDGMALPYQLSYLDMTVEGVDEVVPTIQDMVAAWLAGDAPQLAQIMNAEMEDDYLYDRLLIDRNANWAGWIQQRLNQPGTVFIAVGAGHLAGEGSVQDQLAQRGLSVTRIWQ